MFCGVLITSMTGQCFSRLRFSLQDFGQWTVEMFPFLLHHSRCMYQQDGFPSGYWPVLLTERRLVRRLYCNRLLLCSEPWTLQKVVTIQRTYVSRSVWCLRGGGMNTDCLRLSCVERLAIWPCLSPFAYLFNYSSLSGRTREDLSHSVPYDLTLLDFVA